MTNKEEMLSMVLQEDILKSNYGYDETEYEDMFTALNSENVVVAAVARIIKDLNGSTDESTKRKVYMTVFNYIKDNYLV